MTPTLKKSLIIVWSVAAVLAVIAYIVVFGNPGDYVVIANNSGAGTTSTASGTLALPPINTSTTANASGTGSVGTTSAAAGSFSSDYTSPPITWQEGGETLSITGASLRGNQLTLQLEIDMGQNMECVPMNMRLLTDEEGDLAAPATTQFSFPETGSCEGAPSATYGGQQVVFTVDPTSFPVFVTTGGASNIFFQVATTTGGGVTISLPQKSG